MSYTKTNWQDLPNTTTPINATRLNNIENGIANADGAIDVDAYSNSSTYNVGDYCIYNNKLYVCNTQILTPESFNASHWTQTNIIDEINNIENNMITLKETPVAKSQEITDCAGVKGKLNVVNGDTYQNTSNKIYVCAGTETGTYYFTYNSVNYQFTMPTISSGSILVFNTETLILSLNGTEITTTTGTSGTLIRLSDTPTPVFPVDIRNVGDNINLFDITDTPAYSNNANVEVTGNTLKVSKTSANALCFALYKVLDVTNFVGEKFTLKADWEGSSTVILGLCDNSGGNRRTISSNTISGTPLTVTIPELSTAKNLAIWFYSENSTDITKYIEYTNIKLEKGIKATPYTAYGYGTIDFRVRNANLFYGTLIPRLSISRWNSRRKS